MSFIGWQFSYGARLCFSQVAQNAFVAENQSTRRQQDLVSDFWASANWAAFVSSFDAGRR